MQESFEQFVARVSGNGFVAPPDPTARRTTVAKPVKLPKNKEFHFGTSATPSKYPWDEWLGGQLLLLEQSTGAVDDKGAVVKVDEKKDFEVSVDAMPAKIKTAARRRYKVVQISRRDADGNKLDNALIIRARDMTPDEQAAEDLLRAEEKEDRKAKLATAAANGQATTADTAGDGPEGGEG